MNDMNKNNKSNASNVTTTVGEVLKRLNSIPSDANIKFVDNGFIVQLDPNSDDLCDKPSCRFVEHTEEPKSNNPYSLKNVPTDSILSFPLIAETKERENIENKLLPQPFNCFFTEEVRSKNAMIADMLGEIYRREIAAMLEYITQMQSEHSIIMCDYVNSKNNKNNKG